MPSLAPATSPPLRRAAPLRWAARFVPATEPAERRLAVMAVVDSAGTGLFLTTAVVIFTRMIGLSGWQVGSGLAIAGCLGLSVAVPIGALVDRCGPRRVLMVLSCWRAVGFAAYPWVTGYPGFLAVACFLALAERGGPPVMQSMVGLVTGEDGRVTAMAWIRTLRNIGFTLGALAATVALAADSKSAYRTVLLANAASFVAMAVLARGLPRSSPTRRGRRSAGSRPLADRRFMLLTALNGVLSLHMSLLTVGIPLWVTLHTAVPRTMLAPALATNTILAALFQIRASRGCATACGAGRALRRAGIVLAACCLLLTATADLPAPAGAAVLIAAVVALTAGELLQSAGGWALSYALAPPECQGVYLSAFGLGVSAQQVAGPVALSVLVVPMAAGGWFGLAALLVVCGIGSAIACGRDAPKVSKTIVEEA